MEYNIYAGLSGGFGGCRYQYTSFFENEDEAYNLAVEEYESYEGMHGLPSWDEIADGYCKIEGVDKNNLSDEDLVNIDLIYQEEVDSWLSFLVTTAEEDPNHDRTESW